MNYIKLKNSGQKISVGKIVCVGRNYAEHAKELGNEVPKFPVIFLKPSSAIIHEGETIELPSFSENVHYEGELLLLIGNKIKNASEKEASEAIVAYGAGLDMTLRDLQNKAREESNPWTISKCFDTSAVVSEFIKKDEYELSGSEVIKLALNGEVKQNSSINKMIFDPVKIVKYISEYMTLEEGDIIYTGTPAGVGKVSSGDQIDLSIENIANLSVKVK